MPFFVGNPFVCPPCVHTVIAKVYPCFPACTLLCIAYIESNGFPLCGYIGETLIMTSLACIYYILLYPYYKHFLTNRPPIFTFALAEEASKIQYESPANAPWSQLPPKRATICPEAW